MDKYYLLLISIKIISPFFIFLAPNLNKYYIFIFEQMKHFFNILYLHFLANQTYFIIYSNPLEFKK